MSDRSKDDPGEIRLVINPAATPEEYAAIVTALRTRLTRASGVSATADEPPSRWRQAARREGLRMGTHGSRWGS